MIEVKLDEGDKLDWALKTFKKKVMKSGLLKELRKRRHYTKPSEAKASACWPIKFSRTRVSNCLSTPP